MRVEQSDASPFPVSRPSHTCLGWTIVWRAPNVGRTHTCGGDLRDLRTARLLKSSPSHAVPASA